MCKYDYKNVYKYKSYDYYSIGHNEFLSLIRERNSLCFIISDLLDYISLCLLNNNRIIEYSLSSANKKQAIIENHIYESIFNKIDELGNRGYNE